MSQKFVKEISQIKLGNAITVGGTSAAYWSSKKGYELTMWPNQLMIEIRHLASGAWTLTTIFNCVELKTPEGDRREDPVPTYAESDDSRERQLDLKGSPIPKYGERRDDRPMRVASDLSETNKDWKPAPVPTFEDRQKEKAEAAAARDVPRAKAKKVNAETEATANEE